MQQLSYSGPFANERRQKTLYITERAVFRRNEAGQLELTEIAPGIDLERDVLAQMEFRPEISGDLINMDERIFRPEPMGLAEFVERNRRPVRSPRLARFA